MSKHKVMVWWGYNLICLLRFGTDWGFSWNFAACYKSGTAVLFGPASQTCITGYYLVAIPGCGGLEGCGANSLCVQ